MKRVGLQVAFFVVLAVALTHWLGMSSQEVVAEPDLQVPFLEEWTGSGHADAESEAFRHWDEEEEKMVPEGCAKCHSTVGYLDFLGADGSEFGKIDQPAPAETNQGIECVACHNDAALTLDSVMMPSGVEITGLGDEARCMQCHQGRQSKMSVDANIEEAAVADVDTVSDKIGFRNIHYHVAGAVKYGTVAKGGYEYDGKTYDAEFAHVDGYETCIDCHNPHTLQVKVADCSPCHTGVANVEDLRKVRMEGSLVDFDGDGDMEEGIYDEIVGLQELLYKAIQAYAAEKSGKAIAYESHSYPYFFIDTNADGVADEEEANYGNRYDAWTARLSKAAYNYQVSKKDPGGYAHGGKYIIQLLNDSLEDLNSVLSAPVEAAVHRIDHGHFAGSEEVFRHWDEDGEVPRNCSKCHSSMGLPVFLKEGTNISEPLSNGLECSSCHDDLSTYSRYEVTSVTFPSGATVTTEEADDSNICMNCHQGRQSKNDVDRAAKGIEDDAVSEKLSFRNIHYFAAGATRYGTDVKGGYEYDGKEYVGFYGHVPNFASCMSCHDSHKLEVKEEQCSMCHPQAKDGGLEAIRMTAPDYDGDGAEEGVYGELATLKDALYAAIQSYAADVVKTPIVYNSHNYPYFFTDTNGNGEPDAEESIYPNKYATWTPKLLKAAYNYQYAKKDPGAYAHNGKYVAQLLYDSLDSLGAVTEGVPRP
jgi:hypothetical protein